MIFILKIESLILIILFLLLHLPILILNINSFGDNIYMILKIIANSVIVSLFLISVIRIADIKIKNRVFTSGIIMVVFAMMDLLLDHFNFYAIDEILFDFSMIFTLPYYYATYYIIVTVLIISIIVLTATSIVLSVKKDYFLEQRYEEN
jgi:hypothetical protein